MSITSPTFSSREAGGALDYGQHRRRFQCSAGAFFVDLRANPPYKYQYLYWYLYLYWYTPRVKSRRHTAVHDHKIDRACARGEPARALTTQYSHPESSTVVTQCCDSRAVTTSGPFLKAQERRFQPGSHELEIKSR
jgi:hypothetical protein